MRFLGICVSRSKEVEDARSEIVGLQKQLKATQPSGEAAAQSETGKAKEAQGWAAARAELFAASFASLGTHCEVVKGQVKALQEERDALEAERDSFRGLVDKLAASSEKHLNSAVKMTKTLNHISTQLDGAEGSWNPYWIISDVRHHVLGMQSLAVAQFAMHMDSAVLATVFRAWGQAMRSSSERRRADTKGNDAKKAAEDVDEAVAPGFTAEPITEDTGVKKHAASEPQMDASNPIFGS